MLSSMVAIPAASSLGQSFAFIVRKCVNNWLDGAAGHPLLDVPNSFQVVDISKCIGTNLLREVPAVETSERLHGFFYSKVQLKLLNIHFIHSSCPKPNPAPNSKTRLLLVNNSE